MPDYEPPADNRADLEEQILHFWELIVQHELHPGHAGYGDRLMSFHFQAARNGWLTDGDDALTADRLTELLVERVGDLAEQPAKERLFFATRNRWQYWTEILTYGVRNRIFQFIDD